MLYNHGWEKQQTQRPKGSGPKRVRGQLFKIIYNYLHLIQIEMKTKQTITIIETI